MSSYTDTRVTLSAEARRRIAVANARSRLDLATRNLEALQNEVAAACATYPGEITPLEVPPVPAASTDVAEIERATAHVSALWTERRRQLRSEQERVQRRLMLAGLEQAVEGAATATSDVLGGSPENSEESLDARVVALVDAVDSECTQTELTAVSEAAAGVLGAKTSQRQEALLESLLDRVNLVNRAVDERRGRAARADRLRSDLVGIPGPEAVRLRRVIDLAEEGVVPFDEALATSVATAVERAANRAQSTYVGEVASQILLDQGYRVQVGFADQLADGVAYAQLGEWPEHAIRYTMTGDILSAEQIRVSGPTGDPTLDGAAQAELCAHHERFLADLEARGVDTERARLIPPRLFPSQPGDIERIDFEERDDSGLTEQFIGGG